MRRKSLPYRLSIFAHGSMNGTKNSRRTPLVELECDRGARILGDPLFPLD